jgi:acyl-CoA synthetase (NDP forming)
LSKGFGLSKFVAMGNQADLNAADYLAYLSSDEDTRGIALYLEGLKDSRRFLEVAREVSRQKPILVLKGRRSCRHTPRSREIPWALTRYARIKSRP